jgi:3-oxoacyl-[acyl-carrier-protein] synthase II
MKNKRVVVTGLGPISPIGFGKENLWDSISKNKTGATKHETVIDGKLWDSFLLHKIKNF